ncbi:MAG: DUF115 domain-containing protein [Hahellaceae bacterium]|nr:DUF115 domain-containing protein [Hahellaceae bacterium]
MNLPPLVILPVSLLSRRRLYIFGASKFGTHAQHLLTRYQLEIIAFIDNDEGKYHQRLNSKPIIPLYGLARDPKILIIIASRYYPEIRLQLISLGWKENEDFVEATRFFIAEDYLQLQQSMAAFKGIHCGERAFLIGNGPSLTTSDLNLLKNECCFAANKIYLSFSQTTWRPTYYCVCDPLVSLNIRDQIESIGIPAFLSNNSCFYGHNLQNARILPYFFRSDSEQVSEMGFSFEPEQGLFDGGTVVFMMMQLAVFMGFKKLYFLGLDHSFTIDQDEKTEVVSSRGEINHFHPNYRPCGEKWSRPRLDFIERAFLRAKGLLEPRGIQLVNLSRQTKLQVFDIASLEDIL